MRIALRTQQVIAHETGVANTIDPLGGSYFVEALTDELEAQAYEYFAKIDELGGMVEAVKRNYPQREIADAAFVLQQEIDARRAGRRRRQRPHRGRRRRAAAAADRPGARAQADRPRPGRPRPPRRERRRGRALGAQVRGRARRRQPDAEPPGLRARTRHRGRDRRRPPVRLRHLHRDTRLLNPRRSVRAQAARRRARPRRHRGLPPRPLAAARIRVGDNYFVRAGGVPTVKVDKGTRVQVGLPRRQPAQREGQQRARRSSARRR